MNDKIIKAYALKNAIEHKGNANKNAVINSLFNEGLKKEDIPSIIPKLQLIINEINSISLEEQKK
ncbi:glutamate--tRNA ligase, partial [Candidatus Pacearchaeota archaeon]|nr:glutamate--tRNA ligase [Candidatus Pacearchaeota archaeon]